MSWDSFLSHPVILVGEIILVFVSFSVIPKLNKTLDETTSPTNHVRMEAPLSVALCCIKWSCSRNQRRVFLPNLCPFCVPFISTISMLSTYIWSVFSYSHGYPYPIFIDWRPSKTGLFAGFFCRIILKKNRFFFNSRPKYRLELKKSRFFFH